MKTYDQLVKSMGKAKALKFMQENRSTEKTGFDKTRGIKGRIRYRCCEHGTWVIDDYKERPCLKCMGVGLYLKRKEFVPYFNVGLGAYVESRSEEKRAAKQMGLTEAG